MATQPPPPAPSPPPPATMTSVDELPPPTTTTTTVDTVRTMSKSKKLTLIPLIFLIYFEVAGGPYGEEPAVQAAGSLFAILGFTIFPFIWSILEAFITAELSTAFPGNGGFVIWYACYLRHPAHRYDQGENTARPGIAGEVTWNMLKNDGVSAFYKPE